MKVLVIGATSVTDSFWSSWKSRRTSKLSLT
jgi:hypothetical protein